MTHIPRLLVVLLFFLLLFPPAPSLSGAAHASALRARSDQDPAALFRTEIQQASADLKWHGAPLSENCVYAAALTGASWEPAWDKEHLFWLGWGDCQKRRSRGRRNLASEQNTIVEIHRMYRDRDYRHVLDTAMASFTLDEIACNVDLKEAVGISFMELGQPERAFPILSAPYQSQRSQIDLGDANRLFRAAAWDAAQRAGLSKEAIAFALSLLLEPGTRWPGVDTQALRYLQREGVDLDRVLLGILEAPPRLRGLPAYTYAAADLLALRATPRILPLLLELAAGEDVYLRSRALLGLGVIAFQPRPEDTGYRRARQILDIDFHEYGISASQRAMIEKAVLDAAHDGSYRVRAAAALALGLMGADASLPPLRKLVQDRAYILSPPLPDRSRTQHLVFPVRVAAAAALACYGVDVDADGGDLSGQARERARRGGQDVTHDSARLRRDMVSALAISPTDVALPILPDHS